MIRYLEEGQKGKIYHLPRKTQGKKSLILIIDLMAMTFGEMEESNNVNGKVSMVQNKLTNYLLVTFIP